MMCSYFYNRSLLCESASAKCVLALAIGSKFAGLVIDPNAPPKGIYNRLEMMKEKADAISG